MPAYGGGSDIMTDFAATAVDAQQPKTAEIGRWVWRRRRDGGAALSAAAALLLGGCVPVNPLTRSDRIVSIDYCADQMVLGLVERDRIAAVSVDVASDPGFSLPRSAGLPRVRPEVERVLALRPTLVVRSYGGGGRFAEAMEAAGVPVFTLPYAATLADVDDVMAAAGEALGSQTMASRRREALAEALSRARRQGAGGSALYMTPGDVTTGPGSMISELFAAAGYRSYEQRPGWHRLPVERLVVQPPDLVVRGFFETTAHQQDRWASSAHAALRDRLAGVPTVTVPGSELSCGNWLVGRAAERIANGRRTS